MNTVVRTRSGAVSGSPSEDAVSFLGVPYAAPPLGPRRFLTPEPPDVWDGVREVVAYGPTAPQPGPGLTVIPEPVEPGDDFLNLNIYTPDLGDAGLPVLVWIHGGGFVSGCNRSPWYRGERFARNGVVLVSVGYRLGIEGFLRMEDAPSNRAVLDWIAALEWVQENISAFGGDPGRVTIGGQSAGSSACIILMTNPRARGLFRRVIAMSGTADTRMPAERALELTEGMARHLAIAPRREGFSRLDPFELIEAHAAVAANPFTAEALSVGFDPSAPGLRPFVDGQVIGEHPFRRIREGATADVDLLAGATAHELTGLVRLQMNLEADAAAAALAAMGLQGDRLRAYLDHIGTDDLLSAMGQAATDRAFRTPLAQLLEDRMAATQDPSGRTYGYEFRWSSPSLGNAGAAHCLDVPFVFDNLDRERGPIDLLGAEAPQHLADEMHRAWVGFVTDGDPGWPAYEAGQRTMMCFGQEPVALEDPLAFARDLFTKR